MSIENRVLKLLENHLGIILTGPNARQDVKDLSLQMDLCVDDLDICEITDELEREFDIKIHDASSATLENFDATVQTVIDLVVRYRSSPDSNQVSML